MPFVLEATDLAVRWRGVPVLDGVGLQVGEWEIVGVVGASGSGKSTLVDCLTGVTRPTEGTVRLHGEDVTHAAAHRLVALGVARTWQGQGADPSLTVMENLLTAQHGHIGYHPVAGMVGMPASFRAERELRQNAEEILAFLDLLPLAGRLVAEVPPGLRRFVDLALALATEPDVILLDEPALGMTAEEGARLGATLRSLRDSLSLTILLTDRSLQPPAVCDFVYVLSAGSVVAKGRPGEMATPGEPGRNVGPRSGLRPR